MLATSAAALLTTQGDSGVTFADQRGNSNGVYCWHEHRNYKLDLGSRFSFLQ
jgi:hypothetical protein